MKKMIEFEKLKNFARQYKRFSIVLILEVVFIFALLIASFGRTTTYVLDSRNLIIRDPAVTTEEDGTLFITGRNDEETFSRWIISSDKLSMPYGVYELEVNYCSALYDMEQGGGNRENRTGIIQLMSENHDSGFQYNEIALSDGRTSTTDRIWIRSVTGIEDLEVVVCFYGLGDLYLDSIVVRELPLWRFICIMTWLLLLAVMDAVYVYFFTKNTYKNKTIVAGLTATILFSSLPLFTDSLFSAHDMNFHLLRIIALAEGIRDGHWIVPIQTEMLNGYGYASPLFYGQLFLYLPAILYCMAVPLQVCFQVYIFFINMATCLICYCCMKGLLKDKNLAMIISFFYTLSAYRIANIYVRAAVGEFTAMTFFPLVCYGFAKVYATDEKEITWKDYLPIVFGLSGIIQSHVLSCEMSAFFVVALCILCVKKTLQPKRLLALIKVAALTVSVNLGFLIPFMQSMQMDLEVKYADINEIQKHGTYLLQVLGIFMPSSGVSGRGMAGEMPMALGFSLVIGMVILLYCCVRKYDWKLEHNKLMHIGVFCMGLAAACILLSMRIFPWDSFKSINMQVAKVLCMIQFPWRYLSVGTVFGVFASAIGLKLFCLHKGMKAGKICSGIMITFTLINIGLFYMQYGDSMETVTIYGNSIMDIALSQQVKGGEYLPANTSINDMVWRKIVVDETQVTVDQYDYSDGITTFRCENRSNKEQTVEIPLLKYDNYHAYDMGYGGELEIRNGENNRISVVIKPYYNGMVKILYEVPLVWKLSYMVSAVTLIGIIIGVLCGFNLKVKRTYR